MYYTYFVTSEGAEKLAQRSGLPKKHRKNLATFLRDNDGLYLERNGGDSVLYYDADTGFRVKHGERDFAVCEEIGLNPAMVTRVVVELSSFGYQTPTGVYIRDRMTAHIDVDKQGYAKVRLEATYWHLQNGKVMTFLFNLMAGVS